MKKRIFALALVACGLFGTMAPSLNAQTIIHISFRKDRVVTIGGVQYTLQCIDITTKGCDYTIEE